VLSDEQRRELERRAAAYSEPWRDVVRAKAVLLAAQGLANAEIAERLGVARQSVSEWRRRFFDEAVVDRLTHRAHIIDTGNESWRFRHGLKRKGGTPGRMTRARGATAPPPPSGRQLRCHTTPHHNSSIRQTQPSTTTDAKWGHFKPSRRGQRKPSLPQASSQEVARGFPTANVETQLCRFVGAPCVGGCREKGVPSDRP
jgi:predicted XRE-type DNA-binding protein